MRRGRILAVDDEVEIVRLIERILGRDHDVTICTAPDEALALLQAGQRFDVILSDVMMPRMTGVEMHDAIRALDPAQAERIVFVTASVLTHDLEAALRATARPILRKPVGIKVLRDLVRERID